MQYAFLSIASFSIDVLLALKLDGLLQELVNV
jgi:hypothetical protein